MYICFVLFFIKRIGKDVKYLLKVKFFVHLYSLTDFMGKKEQRNNFSTTRFSIKLLCSLFIKSTIKNIMINLIITDVSFKFNGGFYL